MSTHALDAVAALDGAGVAVLRGGEGSEGDGGDGGEAGEHRGDDRLSGLDGEGMVELRVRSTSVFDWCWPSIVADTAFYIMSSHNLRASSRAPDEQGCEAK